MNSKTRPWGLAGSVVRAPGAQSICQKPNQAQRRFHQVQQPRPPVAMAPSRSQAVLRSWTAPWYTLNRPVPSTLSRLTRDRIPSCPEPRFDLQAQAVLEDLISDATE